MSRNAAKKITNAADGKSPMANRKAAQQFTNKPKNVSRFGLIPVEATMSTIFSSSQRPPSPILRVIMRVAPPFLSGATA